MKSFLVSLTAAFFWISLVAKADVPVTVVPKNIPEVTSYGAWNIDDDASTLGHGCEWFHFLSFGTLKQTDRLKVSTHITASSKGTPHGIYFAQRAEKYLEVVLNKIDSPNGNTTLTIGGRSSANGTFSLASATFNHNNNLWFDGLLEFEIESMPPRFTYIKFDGVEYKDLATQANNQLKDYDITGGFGSRCFLGFVRYTHMKLNGQPVTFRNQ